MYERERERERGWALLFIDKVCSGLVDLLVPVAHDPECNKDTQSNCSVEDQRRGKGLDGRVGVGLVLHLRGTVWCCVIGVSVYDPVALSEGGGSDRVCGL